MRINKISASAVKTYKFCPFQYWLSCVLQMESQSGKAAAIGTIVHQVFEWMGLLTKKGKKIDVDWLIDRAWEEVAIQNPHIKLVQHNRNGESADFKLCKNAVRSVLDNRVYSIPELKVLDVEKRFDIEMPGKIWQTPNGQLRITGYIDMIHEIDSETIEIVDWKTGRRADYGSMKEKDFFDLMKDAQPRIYHFAASQLYPQYKNVLVTFYYINDGGPVTLPYSIEDMIITVGAIWRIYKKIQDETLLTRNLTWRCSKFCQFGRMRVCDCVWKDFIETGLDVTANKYYKMTIAQQQQYKEQS